jgi:hypothetical protein
VRSVRVARAFSSQVETLGNSENAIKRAFSSQVPSLGGSENATRQCIFKPSGFTWRLGKMRPNKHFQAKWLHLAARKMRSNKHFQDKW